MATQTKSGGTFADDATVGTVTWSNPSNAASSNDVYATNVSASYTEIRHYRVQMVKGGTIQGTQDNGSAQLNTTDTYYVTGGAANLWGLAWTVSDVNASDMGFVYAVQEAGGGVISHFIKATNFGFTIPTGATINGFTLRVEQKKDDAADTAYVDHMEIICDYTPAADRGGALMMAHMATN